jgi:hypothetical protein
VERPNQFTEIIVPVDLHQRLSEFSYGYGVTREAERLLQSIGLRTTPFLPSLIQEKRLAFDVKFDRPGTPLLLQFKLGEALQRLIWKNSSPSPPPLGRPFWRFRIDTAESDGQFDLLLRAEQAGAETYYVAPRLSSWEDYSVAYETEQVLEKSLLMRPTEIDAQLAAGEAPDGPHRILYDDQTSYVCSETRQLSEVRAQDFASNLIARIEQLSRRMDIALRDVQIALEHQREIRVRPVRRPESDPQPDAPYVMQAAPARELAPDHDTAAERRTRRFAEFQTRAATESDARFASLGFEAWSIGSQLIAVTLKK